MWDMPILLPKLNQYYKYRQMDEDLLQNREELDFLLNISRISEHNRQCSLNDSIFPDKLNISEKERTREESYQDIMKQIHFAKLQKIELNKQLETLKNDISHSYLQQFRQEFKQLNQENISLRQQLAKPTKKYNEDKSERYSNRSSIKMKTSIKSNYGDQNKKTNTKPRRNHVSPNHLLKKDAKLAQSTANLGRSQIQSPQKQHKKRESQLTERKAEENNSIGVSVNISILDDKFDCCNIRESVSNQQLNVQNNPEKNIFLQFLENILIEEKEHQEQKYQPLQHYFPPTSQTHSEREVLFINQMEAEIKESHQKLEMLTLILAKYQKDMAQLNFNLHNVQEWTDKLWEVKGKYVQMQTKCIQLAPLTKQVKQKEEKLNKLRECHLVREEQKSIASIETMIKLLSNCNSALTFSEPTKLYMRYWKEIKELFKMDKEEQSRRYNKIIKVKQAIDSIREGRKKFNELILIYEARITKLQEKINKVKANNQKR